MGLRFKLCFSFSVFYERDLKNGLVGRSGDGSVNDFTAQLNMEVCSFNNKLLALGMQAVAAAALWGFPRESATQPVAGSVLNKLQIALQPESGDFICRFGELFSFGHKLKPTHWYHFKPECPIACANDDIKTWLSYASMAGCQSAS